MRRGPDLAIVIGSIAVAAALMLVPINIWLTVTGSADTGLVLVDRVLFHLPPLTFGPVGLLIAIRRRGNPIAWILIALGFGVAASATAGEAARGDVGPIALWLLGVANSVGYVLYVALVGALVLVFPDGRLPSPRWWPAGALVAGWVGVALVALMFAPSIPHEPDPIPNPFGVPEVLSQFAETLPYVILALLIPLLLAVVAAAFVRWRRSIGVERQQLELFVYVASFVLLGYLLIVSGLPGPWSSLIDLAILALPVAILVAVFRYRLYDIDVLIERTLVYGALSATVALTYWLLVLVLQSALRPITGGGGELAVAASTLATLALVQPLRSRIQRGVDRRFYRARYDAARTLDDFSVRLRDEVDLDAVRANLIDAVGQTVQPATASLWLRERAR
jgi:hypothetical protein